jgi:transcriptional regulator with XRE-family HTH domain
MNTFDIWNKLSKSKKYREEYVAALLKRSVPFQIRTLLKKRGFSQQELAEKSELTQGVISRAQDSNYGNLTFNTVVRIAAGFDCAFIGKFVPFSELAKWDKTLSEDSIVVPEFSQDLGFVEDAMPTKLAHGALGNIVDFGKKRIGAAHALQQSDSGFENEPQSTQALGRVPA